ncbi:MAG: tetratricopeptide repeat protein [Methylobacter sp.]
MFYIFRMKKLVLVVLLLLSNPCLAESLKDSLKNIESEWAVVYYSTPKSKQGPAYIQLLNKSTNLAKQYPNTAEPIFWQAVLKATYAEHQDAFSALEAIQEARDLLLKAIKINPETMNGAAYVTLGTLYYMVPKWPISFGDDDIAQQMLETALKINPDGIDTNYFYGEFLLRHHKVDNAAVYFERASSAPPRSEQLYADNQLKEEAKLALKNTQERKINDEKGLFLSVFNSASAK